MDLKIALHQPAGVRDLVVSLEPVTAVGVLADRLRTADPDPGGAPDGDVTLAVLGVHGWKTLPPSTPVAESGLRSGAATAVVLVGGRASGRGSDDRVAAILTVLKGPDQGREVSLGPGEWVLGRGAGADVSFTDRLVSKRHAVLRVDRDVRLIDQNSANGTQIDGVSVGAAWLGADNEVTLGDTVVRVRPLAPRDEEGSRTPVVPFNRPPVPEPAFAGGSEELRDPPQRPPGHPFPFISVLMPLGLAFATWRLTGAGLASAFLALSSVMLVGALLEQSAFTWRAHRKARSAYRAEMQDQRRVAAAAEEAERAAREAEHPSVAEVTDAVLGRTSLLWARRPDHDRFGDVRLGVAARPRRAVLTVSARGGDADLLAEARRLTADSVTIDGVPVVGSLRSAGALGVCGPTARRREVVRGVALQLVALHPPADLRVFAVLPPAAAEDWRWLRWLPHCPATAESGLAALADDADACGRVVATLEALVLDRARASAAAGVTASPPLPLTVLVVEDGAPVDRGRLVSLAQRGAPLGVHLLWSADRHADLPAVCRTYLSLGPDGGVAADVVSGEQIARVRSEGIDVATAESLARALAPVVDTGIPPDGQADLPRSASFVEHSDRGLALAPAGVAERWRETGPPQAGTLRALVGQGPDGPFHLDLREHGPHALVGGTTGAGKSEFLQSWLLGMSLNHSPDRVTFLLVDYKGGAAFADVVGLPHAVGLVTDLSPRLVRRALASLRAEVRHRERVLAAAGAPDLREMERRGDPAAPPSLVIVVDEFAALVQEVPEFVDGVIDVAQRGRSLGLHLVLATQRPAGVIKDNLRANTNLRVALRMADADDSVDVLGSADAALFDPGTPGRAMARTGPGRISAFQALYAGGRSGDLTPAPEIAVATLGIGAPVAWTVPDRPTDAAAGSGPTDVQRVVDTIRRAADETAVAVPRRPWLPELPAVVDLGTLQVGDGSLAFGLVDEPDLQRQTVAAYRPDRDGALLVLGTGGSGKSAVLRSLALAAAAEGAGAWHVYGLDFGARGLASLEGLPYVGAVVQGEDQERVFRLIDKLRSVVDERAHRYAAVDAGTIEAYRLRTGMPQEPRILLLLDNFGAFRSAFELGRDSRVYEALPALALDGRSVGVHVAISADRPGVVPPGLAAATKRQVSLRLVQDMDLATVGLAPDAFAADAPPGRGWLDGAEVQVGVIAGESDVARQAEVTRQLAERLYAAGVPEAPPVGRLVDRVDLSQLRPVTDGMPTLGVASDTLEEFGFARTGTFLIAGPPQSGRTTALLTAVRSILHSSAGLRLAYFGPSGSPLVGTAGPPWELIAHSALDVAKAAEAWTERANDGVPLVAVIENVPAFGDTPAQEPLEQMVAALVAAGHVVLGDGETSALTASWGLPLAMKAARHGLLLQPDQQDGDSVLRTALPRMARADFPPGRGVYVRSGRVRVVQVAQPA